MSEAPVEIEVAEQRATIFQNPERPVLDQNFRPIEKGESFPGGMPILLGEDRTKFNEQAISLYGERVGGGKWGDVLLSDERATKIFKDPENILNAYDLEFMRKYGGVAGLPKFIGVVPNGYQMERFRGESLTKLVNQEFSRNRGLEISASEKWNRILSREQAQELLDRVAEFHKGTGRVHGDLGHWDDVVVEPDGRIRLTDPEWERIGGQTPSGELKSLYDFFTGVAGYKDLVLPGTISDEESQKNLQDFEQKVVGKVEMDKVIGQRIIDYRDRQVDIKIGEDGKVLVKRKESR